MNREWKSPHVPGERTCVVYLLGSERQAAPGTILNFFRRHRPASQLADSHPGAGVPHLDPVAQPPSAGGPTALGWEAIKPAMPVPVLSVRRARMAMESVAHGGSKNSSIPPHACPAARAASGDRKVARLSRGGGHVGVRCTWRMLANWCESPPEWIDQRGSGRRSADNDVARARHLPASGLCRQPACRPVCWVTRVLAV